MDLIPKSSTETMGINHFSYNCSEDLANSNGFEQLCAINGSTAVTDTGSFSPATDIFITTINDTLATLALSGEFNDPGYTLRYGLLGSIMLG